MTYTARIDLGTTFTAAAVAIDGHGEMINLSSQHPSVASIVWLGPDGTWLVGEPARRRGMTEPDRLAREFKRRLGDPAPVILGGTPVATQMLMAELLDWTLGVVSERQGGPPDAITITHPANWGDYRVSLLQAVVDGADLRLAALLTEPEAAAIDYATRNRVPDGTTVGVYDLGGGTFDAAVIRRAEDDFQIVGRPAGIESLGGIDFDAAVFDFVTEHVGGIDDLDPDDPGAASQINRLRSECEDAKIALSSATETVIPVILPGRSEQVRLTRAEFEERIMPLIDATIDSLRSALHRAEITPSELHSVLLVGGSSRIPLIGQMVTSALGRPVAVDSDPKHGIARGAAHHAARRLAVAAPAVAPVQPTPELTVAPIPVPPPSVMPPPVAQPSDSVGAPSPVTGVAAAAPVAAAPPPAPVPSPPPVPQVTAPQPVPSPGEFAEEAAPTPNRLPLVIGAIVAAAILVVVSIVVLGGGDSAPADDRATPPETPAPTPDLAPAPVVFAADDADRALTTLFEVDTIRPDYDVSDCDKLIEIPKEVRVPFDFEPGAGIYVFSSSDAATRYIFNEVAKDGKACGIPGLDLTFSIEVAALDDVTIDKFSTREGATEPTHIRLLRQDNAVVFAVATPTEDDLTSITEAIATELEA